MQDNINPNNSHQARVLLSSQSQFMAGEERHPQIIFKELAEKLEFKILASVPQTMFDCWEFWIEFKEYPELPDYFYQNGWSPVGQA